MCPFTVICRKYQFKLIFLKLCSFKSNVFLVIFSLFPIKKSMKISLILVFLYTSNHKTCYKAVFHFIQLNLWYNCNISWCALSKLKIPMWLHLSKYYSTRLQPGINSFLSWLSLRVLFWINWSKLSECVNFPT